MINKCSFLCSKLCKDDVVYKQREKTTSKQTKRKEKMKSITF